MFANEKRSFISDRMLTLEMSSDFRVIACSTHDIIGVEPLATSACEPDLEEPFFITFTTCTIFCTSDAALKLTTSRTDFLLRACSCVLYAQDEHSQ